MRHVIILGSSFSSGKRIALDYCEDRLKTEETLKEIDKIKSIQNEQISIAMHVVSTKSCSWAEVVKMDPFFKDVKLVKSKEEFFKKLQDDKTITSLDIADYILTKFNCTHTRLQKLLYYCYADYLCKFNEKLFNDKIYAFKYGPVISLVYEKYKHTRYDVNPIEVQSKYEMPIRSRILVGDKGLQKINSIEETLSKYKYYNTRTLIALTHRKNTPWEVSHKGEREYEKILDEKILLFHKNEEC
ncbi:MAG: DUF4065 domain-containing protein [Clostridia bacterium]|nr:DUF4065 domain-containing protein [Clostridia bacterium]